LDEALRGGLDKGELGVVVAPTGFGKSFFLISLGVHALKKGYKVLHVSLELSKRKLISRYESRLTEIPKLELLNEEEKIKRVLNRAARFFEGDILFAKFPTYMLTPEELRANITHIRLVKEFEPDLIIIDYADIMKPSNFRRGESSFEVGKDIYLKLRSLAEEFSIPIWTASQSVRESYSKEIVTMRDVSESIAKPQLADVVITISKSQDEKEEDRGRFFLAKVREGKANITIPFEEDFDIGKFEELGDEELNSEL